MGTRPYSVIAGRTFVSTQEPAAREFRAASIAKHSIIVFPKAILSEVLQDFCTHSINQSVPSEPSSYRMLNEGAITQL